VSAGSNGYKFHGPVSKKTTHGTGLLERSSCFCSVYEYGIPNARYK